MITLIIFLDIKQIRKIWRVEKYWIKPYFKKIWLYIKDWRTFISFLLAWSITNSWCYVFIALGTWLRIRWMRITGLSYLAFLWAMPEKFITIPLGVLFKKLLFKRRK